MALHPSTTLFPSTTTFPESFAPIAFRDSASGTADTTTTSHTVTVPASVQTGDMMLVIYAVKTTAAPTPPAGWTIIGSHIDPASTDVGTSAYWRIAQAGDAGTPFTWTAPSAATGTVGLAAWSGVTSIAGVLTDNSATSTSSPTSATTTGTGGLDVVALGVRGTASAGAGPTFTAPLGYTERLDVTNAPTSELECAVTVADNPTIDPTVAKTFTASQSVRAVGMRFLLQGDAPAVTPVLSHATSGGITDTTAKVAVRGTNATTATVTLSPGGAQLQSAIDADGCGQVAFTGLTANTAYTYTIDLDTTEVGTGTFTTFPTSGLQTDFSLVFGSCMRGPLVDPDVFLRMPDHNPLMLIHLGDFHYNDIATDDKPGVLGAYQQQFNDATFNNFLRGTPIAYMYDNHCWGGEGSHAGTASAPAVKAAYRQLFPSYPLVGDADGAAYQTWTIGRVRFLLLDNRSQRDDGSLPESPTKTMLGANQKAWLKDQLLNALEPVKVICIGFPWQDTSSDRWASFTDEFNEINDYIVNNGITGVYAIGGDNHSICADNGTNNSAGIPNAIAATFDQTNFTSPGTYSEGVATVSHQQYGVLEFTDTGDAITVDFTGYAVDPVTSTESVAKTMSTTFTLTEDGAGGAVTFRDSATGIKNTAVTAHTITVPTTVQPGDLMLVVYAVKTPGAPTPPAGWTIIGSHISPSSSDVGTSAYYRLAQLGDAGNTFTWTAPVAEPGTLGLAAWSGVSQTAPITGTLVDNSANSTTSPSSATTTGTGNLDVVALGVRGTASAGPGPTFTPPSGYTERVDVTNDQPSDLECAVTIADSTVPDPTAAKTFTSSDSVRAVGMRFLIVGATTPVGSVIDTFDDGVIDPAVWVNVGTTQESGGRARVQCASASTSQFRTNGVYTLQGSQCFLQAFPADSNGATSGDVYTKFSLQATNQPAGTELAVYVERRTEKIRFQNLVGGVDAGQIELAYSATDHRWLRIVENAGILSFETSPDGIDWTSRRSITTPAYVTGNSTFRVNVEAHRDTGTTNFAEFDNLNFQFNRVGTGSLLVTGSLGGSGIVSSASGTGSLLQSSTLLTTGKKASPGFGELFITATVINPLKGGTGSLAISAALTSTGKPAHLGSGTLPVVVALTGAGSVREGSLNVQVTLTGSGVGTQPPIVIKRRRTRWQFVVGPGSGGHDDSLTNAKSRKLVARLTDPSEITFSIDGRTLEANSLLELQTDVHVLWSPETGPARILGRGRLAATGDDLDADRHEVEMSAHDYREMLNRRILWSDSKLTYAPGTEQAQIAWELIEQTQKRPGGNLGISRGLGQDTGQGRERNYEAGDVIGERIQELSEVIDGFDWDITPVSPSALHLDIFYPQRGTDRDVTLEFGGKLVQSLRREVDPSSFANAVRLSGEEAASGVAPTPQEREAIDLATRPEGRWDASIGETITLTNTLVERADFRLAEAQTLIPTYTLTMPTGTWDGPDHIWVGDTVRLIVPSGRLKVDTPIRVYEIAIDIPDTGVEQVELTLGGPRFNITQTIPKIFRQLNKLARR